MITPPTSNRAARITSGPLGAEQIARRGVPELGAEAQRLLVDALVVAVEHRAELVVADARAEQPEAVGDGAGTAEEAGIGRAHHHQGDGRRSREEARRGALQGVPQWRGGG